MKMISKTALAAAMLVAGGGIATMPATAAPQKKADADAKGPQMKLSNDFRKVAAPEQQAIESGDLATAQAGLPAVQAAAKTDDEKYLASKFALVLTSKQISAGTAQEDALAGPIEALLANPKTPQNEQAQYNFIRGSIAYNAKKYAEAIPYLTKAQQLGYQDQNLNLMLTQAKVEGGDVKGGVADIQKQIDQEAAAGKKPSEDLYKYAISRLYKANDYGQALTWTQRWLTAYPTATNWRAAVYTFGLTGPNATRIAKNQRIDLFRLLSATNALGDQNDYLEYATLAQEIGLPNEAKSVVEEGLANGKIPKGNSTASEINSLANKSISNDTPLATLDTRSRSAAKGNTAQQTADAYLGRRDYAKAADLYRLALQKGGVDTDKTNLDLGIALAQSGDLNGANTAFSSVTKAPESDIAKLWQTYVQTKGGPSATAGAAATASN